MIDAILENRFLSNWSAFLPRAPNQVGSIHESDAELVPLGNGRLLAVTVDTICEEVATGLYRDPRTVGRIAVIASLSDLAAVGADPIGLLSSVGLPAERKKEIQTALALGIAEASHAAGTFVLGGDTNEQAGLTVTCVAIGTTPAGLETSRIGTRPGDIIFVSGPLGLGSALAASVFLSLDNGLEEHQFTPPIRLHQGKILRGIASACIDTSDGFISALDQLVRLNGVAARITPHLERILHPEALRVHKLSGLPAFPFLAGLLGEYELLFTVPEAKLGQLRARAAQCSWEPLEVGRIECGEGTFIGSSPVDSAHVRNLWETTSGDIKSYVEQLCGCFERI